VTRLVDGELRMNEGEFRMFAELVRSHCGLHFGPETRFLLERRVERRMRELCLDSFAAYHLALRSATAGGGELGRLIDEITTNETYFFRERRQLTALVSEILPEALLQRRERGGGPVTVWSAGCASGEEPYTIVMMAMEAGIDPSTSLRVYAADISRRMLQRARQGTYRESSFRETDPGLRARYFAEKDGQWRISDEVRKHVDFLHLNLLDRGKIALLGALDVILCRNVLIYFEPAVKADLVRRFRAALLGGNFYGREADAQGLVAA
jgi:chemotaxis protein methyltransferase CheR